MKTKKIILTLSLVLFAAFAVVACSPESVLMNNIISATNQITYASNDYSNANVQAATELSMDETFYVVQTLSETTTEEPVVEENPFITFNELRQDLIATHQEIQSNVDIFKGIAVSVKEKANILRDKDYVLLEEDREAIVVYIDQLKAYYDDLMATKGMAYARLQELEYTRANLDVVNQTFVEVQEVLDYRLEILLEANIIAESINEILSDYMES